VMARVGDRRSGTSCSLVPRRGRHAWTETDYLGEGIVDPRLVVSAVRDEGGVEGIISRRDVGRDGALRR